MPPSQARSLPARSLMADCYAREMDDLHCWWLPPEIFADIGIAAPTSAADVEGVAARLAGLLGGVSGKEAMRSTPPPLAAAYQQREQVCGLEGMVLVPYGGVVAAPRPFLPNSPVQWQAPINHVNGCGGGGVLDPRPSPLRLRSPPPPNWVGGGGTGVFLPRSEAYRSRPPAATKSPAKAADGKTQKDQLVNQQQRDEAAKGMKRQPQGATAAGTVQLQQQNAAAAAAYGSPELRLPKEWVY